MIEAKRIEAYGTLGDLRDIYRRLWVMGGMTQEDYQQAINLMNELSDLISKNE